MWAQILCLLLYYHSAALHFPLKDIGAEHSPAAADYPEKVYTFSALAKYCFTLLHSLATAQSPPPERSLKRLQALLNSLKNAYAPIFFSYQDFDPSQRCYNA